ncbi:MAG: hypothetical protein U9Q70_07265 [Chloroflexota bacterium]|nr:hypothetical protein [Chloroflexota bacterium]
MTNKQITFTKFEINGGHQTNLGLCYELVAEQILEFPRQAHQQVPGLSGGNSDEESWFQCRWCREWLPLWRAAAPCPRSPFPKFTLTQLMARLASLGIPVLVRADPLRTERIFTVLLANFRLGDTDAPLLLLVTTLGSALQALDTPAGPDALLAKLRGAEVVIDEVRSYAK